MECVQEELGLGPNGGLIYAIEYLDKNLDWLQEKLAQLEKDGCYFLFDCPGQVELFTLKNSMKSVIKTMTNAWHYRLVAIQLVDAHLCADPAKYMGALLLSLETMLHLELPQINILSKYDLLGTYGKLDFSPQYYLEAEGLEHLADSMEGLLPPRFASLGRALCEVIEDFGLLKFIPLAIEDKESVMSLLPLIDRSNGFVFAGSNLQAPPNTMRLGGLGWSPSTSVWESMADRYIKSGDDDDDVDDECSNGVVERLPTVPEDE